MKHDDPVAMPFPNKALLSAKIPKDVENILKNHSPQFSKGIASDDKKESDPRSANT